MNSLSKFYKRYERIVLSSMSTPQKDRELTNLMLEIEREFDIPSLLDKWWVNNNKNVIALYRAVSESRSV